MNLNIGIWPLQLLPAQQDAYMLYIASLYDAESRYKYYCLIDRQEVIHFMVETCNIWKYQLQCTINFGSKRAIVANTTNEQCICIWKA